MGHFVFMQDLDSLGNNCSIFTNYQDLCSYLVKIEPWDILENKANEPNSIYSKQLEISLRKAERPFLDLMKKFINGRNFSQGFYGKLLSLIEDENIQYSETEMKVIYASFLFNLI